MTVTVITERLREILGEQDPWLYVDDSPASQAVLQEARLFVDAGLITISDALNGYKDEVLPRLLIKGDLMGPRTALRHLQFLKMLNEEFLTEENQAVP